MNVGKLAKNMLKTAGILFGTVAATGLAYVALSFPAAFVEVVVDMVAAATKTLLTRLPLVMYSLPGAIVAAGRNLFDCSAQFIMSTIVGGGVMAIGSDLSITSDPKKFAFYTLRNAGTLLLGLLGGGNVGVEAYKASFGDTDHYKKESSFSGEAGAAVIGGALGAYAMLALAERLAPRAWTTHADAVVARREGAQPQQQEAAL